MFFLFCNKGSKYVGDWWLAYWISEERAHDLSTVYYQYRQLQLVTYSNTTHHKLKYYLTVYGTIAASNSVCDYSVFNYLR